MRKSVAAVLCVMLVLTVATAGWAAEAATDAKPAMDAAKDMAVTVMGKIECKTEKVNDVESKVPYISVADAMSADGQKKLALIGKSLKITGAHAAHAATMDKKEVKIMGAVKDNMIDVASITESAAKGPDPLQKPGEKPMDKPAEKPAPAMPKAADGK